MHASEFEQALESLCRRIGANVRRLREAKGWTQSDLTRACGVRKSHVSRLEAGKNEPKIGTLIRVAAALGVRLEELFQEEQP